MTFDPLGQSIWRDSSPVDVEEGVVAGQAVVVPVLGLKLVKFALKPLEVSLWSDLKRTTMVFPLDSTGFGFVFPQNLPLEKEKEESRD